MWKSEFRQNYYRTAFSPTVPPFAARISRVVADGGTWRLKWERLKAGESNGKLPPRTCPGCSVPVPYQSHDWAMALAKPGLQGWILMTEWICTDIQYILEMRDSQNQTSGTPGFREGFPHKNFLNIYFIYRVRVLIVVTTGIDDVSWDVMPWSRVQMFQQEPVPSITIDLHWWWRQQVPLKHQYTYPRLNGVTSQTQQTLKKKE